jgi:hypothetical protein
VQRLQHHETRLVERVIRAVAVGQHRLRKCRGAVADQIAKGEEGGGHGVLRRLLKSPEIITFIFFKLE